MRSLDSRRCGGDTRSGCGEAGRTVSFRGSKSRNKVSVGESAEGSLEFLLSLGDPRGGRGFLESYSLLDSFDK